MRAFGGPVQNEDDDDKDDRMPGPIVKQLLEHRTILLTGPVTDEMSQKIVAQLLVLDAQESDDPIRVFINSPGGSVDAGFAIYDVMRFVKSPVHSICTGLAASAATVILLGADKKHRYSLPNTRFLIHQPSTGMQGQASDVAIGAEQIIKLRKRVNELLASETGQDVERIAKDTHRDYWMSADEALEYGLVTTIVASATELP